MFFWRAGVLLDELRRHLPKTATILAGLPPFASRKFAAEMKRCFPLCEDISIDYAVLEKSKAWPGSRRPNSAGTTSAAGTPSTSCWRATDTAT